MTYCIYIFVAIVLAAINALHLSPSQMYSIRGLLMNPALTPPQRESLQNLLYVTHEKWAYKRATEFKQRHCYKCRDLSIEDLTFSSKIGLLKSSKKYNGQTSFIDYSEIYLKSEMLRTLTTHLSITSCVSPKIRMSSKTPTNNYTETYPIIIRHNRNTVSAIFQPQVEIQHKEFYRSVWEFVDTFNAFTKYVIRTKYDAEFKVRKSNREIAELMCCSEENVRKSITLFSREYLLSATPTNETHSEYRDFSVIE
jgi:RNA polymerase sigma factor (sigma-70 family)